MFTKITKITKSIALLAFTALCLTGCFPTGEKPVTGNAEYADIKKRADKIDNFTLELQLPENAPESVPTVKLTWKELNVDDIYRAFGDGGSVISSEEYPSDYNLDAVYHIDKLDSVVTLIYERGRLIMDRYLDAEDSSVASQKSSEYHFLAGMIEDILYDDPRINAELQGFSREEAVKMANEVFDKLGIKIYSKPQIFTLSAEFAKELISEYAWDTDPEGYYLIYPAVIENIPTLSKRAKFKMDLSVAVSPIRMVISKDRVEYFSCNHLYDNEYEKTGETPIKFNAAEALDVLVSYYEPQKLATEVGFTSCELVYVPVERSEDIKSVVYKPAWLFTGYEKSNHIDTIYIYELVYADTGARAVTG